MDITRCYFETIGKLIFEELNEVSDTNSILFKKKKKIWTIVNYLYQFQKIPSV